MLLLLGILVTTCTLHLAPCTFASEITILYTGETHAMLYPCDCPREPDGGVARRATLVKQIRKGSPDALLLDSGGFFAGGVMDEYTQNTDLDKERTKVALRAMRLMHYDAAAIGDEEFNFGREFLEQAIQEANFKFLSSNIKSDKVTPYILKDIGGTKVGIIGLTTLSAIQKAEGLKFVEPQIALRRAVENLKSKEGADIVVVLSHSGENNDLALVKEIQGIDILVVGHARSKEEGATKVGSLLVLRPSWQGRRLGKLTLSIKDNKIADYKIEDMRLSDQIKDDPEVRKFLPACFSDSNCKKKGFLGACLQAGTPQAACEFSQPQKVGLTVITSKACRVCDTEAMVKSIRAQFPGLSVSYLYYPDAKAAQLLKEIGLDTLPVYLLGKEIEKEKGFVAMRESLEAKGAYYLLKTSVGGVSYFTQRPVHSGQIDLFISLYDKGTTDLLKAIRDFRPLVHFLAIENPKGGFDAARGNLEVEECLRAVCVQKYYPKILWDYITCRSQNSTSSWWEDCLGELDAGRIKACARAEEGKTLLKENIAVNREIQALYGPTYLLDNQQVFGTQGVPTKEELKKILKR
jgi:hypothetical protein